MSHFTLAQWLAEFDAHCPRLRGISQDDLLDQYGDDLGVWAKFKSHGSWTYGKGTSSDAWFLFAALAHMARFSERDDRWRAHADWVRSFDHKDSDGWGPLPAMMGLTWQDLRQGGWGMGNDGVGGLLARCNQVAEERGLNERLFSVTTHGDNHVIVMLSPAEARSLVAAGLIDLDRPMPLTLREKPPPPETSALETSALKRHADLLPVPLVALLSIPTFFLFHDRKLALVPVIVAVLMLREPIVRRVSWLRWLSDRNII